MESSRTALAWVSNIYRWQFFQSTIFLHQGKKTAQGFPIYHIYFDMLYRGKERSSFFFTFLSFQNVDLLYASYNKYIAYEEFLQKIVHFSQADSVRKVEPYLYTLLSRLSCTNVFTWSSMNMCISMNITDSSNLIRFCISTRTKNGAKFFYKLKNNCKFMHGISILHRLWI